MAHSQRMRDIITDVHNLVNKHRKQKGLEPWVFEDRELEIYKENVVADIIANTEANHKINGVTEQPPTCQCKPGCTKLVLRSVRGGGWNKFARGHRPAGIIKTSNYTRSAIDDNIELVVKVMSKDQYDIDTKVKDKRILGILNGVNTGDIDEVTVIYLQPDQIKPVYKALEAAVKVLRFTIDITKEHDHIALTKR